VELHEKPFAELEFNIKRPR